MNETLVNALRWRYAVKVFDPSRHVSDEDLHTILESAQLAPSSLGTEPWKFFVVDNPTIRAELRSVGYEQSKITDADRLIVVAYRTDARERLAEDTVARTAGAQHVDPSALSGLHQMIAGSIAARDDQQLEAWLRAQSYIPLGMMMQTAALLGVDTCPMEGFDVGGVNNILGFPEKHLSVATMLAVGYRGDDSAAARPKVRRDFDDVVEFLA